MMKPRTVLYAENDEDDAFFMRRAFEQARLPHRLEVVEDGRGVLARLEAAQKGEATLPDLLLLDLKMPHVGGLDVLAWLRQQPEPIRSLPALLITSSNLDRDVTRAKELGARGYIVKPANGEMLRHVALMISVRFLDGAAASQSWLRFPEQP